MERPKKLIIGLTGGIATGKTTYTVLFKSLGARTLCCDEIAHRSLRKNSQVYHEIIRLFGKAVLDKEKRIDRHALGKVVFKNKKKRSALEKIIHPYVFEKIHGAIKSTHSILIIDVPLLFETGFEKEVDKTIVIWCSRATQIERLMRRDGVTRDQAIKRIEVQMPLSQKKRKADYVIDNTDLKKGVTHAIRLWGRLMRQTEK
jgi:dephospho-CoA kinase